MLRWEDFAKKAKPGKSYPVSGDMPHPLRSGFSKIKRAWPKPGKIADYVRSHGKSRIHVHEFVNGEMEAHVDRFDPKQAMLAHAVFETEIGKVALFVGVAAMSYQFFKNRKK